MKQKEEKSNIIKIINYFQLDIGFSWKGLAVFLLSMLPNVLYFILKDSNGRSVIVNNHFLLDIIEHVSQVIFAVLLIFLVSRKEAPILFGYMVFISLFLLSYFGLWIVYFTVRVNFIILMLMAIIPVLYFILTEIWLHNLPAVVFTVIFGIAHLLITYIDYR